MLIPKPQTAVGCNTYFIIFAIFTSIYHSSQNAVIFIICMLCVLKKYSLVHFTVPRNNSQQTITKIAPQPKTYIGYLALVLIINMHFVKIRFKIHFDDFIFLIISINCSIKSVQMSASHVFDGCLLTSAPIIAQLCEKLLFLIQMLTITKSID